MQKYEQVYEELTQNRNNLEKYQHQGIYSISITLGEEKKILYIGKSKNMLKRLSAHMTHTQYPYCSESHQNKYKIYRQLIAQGYTLKFEVLEYTTLLDEAECYWINKYLPPLNYQIPKESGGYRINKKARTIQVQEILNV